MALERHGGSHMAAEGATASLWVHTLVNVTDLSLDGLD